jgi:hypothetical protein
MGGSSRGSQGPAIFHSNYGRRADGSLENEPATAAPSLWFDSGPTASQPTSTPASEQPGTTFVRPPLRRQNTPTRGVRGGFGRGPRYPRS